MKFTFVVITYNQENYILEHLESIKYQIVKYGKGFDFMIIIADDGSLDGTIKLAEYWVSKNMGLFCETVFLADRKNKGTCYNFTKTWEYIDGNYCRVSAGDDVYSNISLFDDLDLLDRCEILSGLPLILINGKVSFPRSMIYHMIATEIIYKDRDYLERLKMIHVDNTPSMMLPVKVFSNESIRSFVRKYFLIEDYPLHIKMAEEYAPLRYIQLKKFFVLYRKTDSSVYLIRQEHCDKDKVDIFNYLISSEKKVFQRLLLKNRLFCYTMKNRMLAKVINLSYYIYLFELLIRSSSITRAFSEIHPDMSEYQAHATMIAESTRREFENYYRNNPLPKPTESLTKKTG